MSWLKHSSPLQHTAGLVCVQLRKFPPVFVITPAAHVQSFIHCDNKQSYQLTASFNTHFKNFFFAKEYNLVQFISGILCLLSKVTIYCDQQCRVPKFFIHQLTHKWIVLKTILKFTLKFTIKQLQHISVQSPSSGRALLELAKVTVVKIINWNTSVWLIRWCGCVYC
jgi:hypothetical protein